MSIKTIAAAALTKIAGPAAAPKTNKRATDKAASAKRVTDMTNAHMEAEFPARATDKEVKAATARAKAAAGITTPTAADGGKTLNKINQLKALAQQKYNDDGGTMAETYTDESYATAITEHGTALKAWKAHMEIHAAKQEQVDMEPADEETAAQMGGTMPIQDNPKNPGVLTNAPKEAPPIPTTGYTGPMRALRDRVKAGAYKKAANGQPSCGDNVANILGHLEPKEVIRACLIAMDIKNPYTHLNIGQQSMNLRNKLRGMMKRGEFGEGVLREAVEVVTESRPAPAPAK